MHFIIVNNHSTNRRSLLLWLKITQAAVHRRRAIIVSVMKVLPARVEQLSQGLSFTSVSQLTTKSRKHPSSSLVRSWVSELYRHLVSGEGGRDEERRIGLPVHPG